MYRWRRHHEKEKKRQLFCVLKEKGGASFGGFVQAAVVVPPPPPQPNSSFILYIKIITTNISTYLTYHIGLSTRAASQFVAAQKQIKHHSPQSPSLVCSFVLFAMKKINEIRTDTLTLLTRIGDSNRSQDSQQSAG